MPKKLPKRVAFKVLVPEDLIPEIDEYVTEGKYNGRGDFAFALIRKYIDERRHEKVVEHEYELYKQKAKERKQKED